MSASLMALNHPEASELEATLGGRKKLDVAAECDYLRSLRRFQSEFRRRRARFASRESGKDTDRMFIISDDRPWVVFGVETHLQQRRWVWEASFPHIWPALHWVALAGEWMTVKQMLARQKRQSPPPVVQSTVCTLERDQCGRIALHHAVIREHWKVVKLLIRRPDAPIQLRTADNSRRTPVHYVLEKMERQARRFCQGRRAITLETVVMRTNSRRYRHCWKFADRILVAMTTSSLSTKEQGDESIRELDCRCRGDVWDACRSGDVRRLKMIVQLYYSGVGRCAKLLGGDAELSELRWTLLHEACARQHAAVVHYLLTELHFRQLIMQRDAAGCTPLHHAARCHSLDVCALLLDDSEDVEVGEVADTVACCQDVRGRTALHWCLLGPSEEYDTRMIVARFLAESCVAALHICDHDGVSPLHLAIWRGDADLVQFLIDLGADVNASVQSPSNALEVTQRVKTKAHWAPCGRVLQSRRRKATPALLSESQTPEISKVQSETVSVGKFPSDSDSTLKPTAVQLFGYPSGDPDVDALSYWTRRMTANQCVSVCGHEQILSVNIERVTDLEKPVRDGDPASDELIGCLKYGGNCELCATEAISQIDGPVTVAAAKSEFRTISPLILATRLCSRASSVHYKSRVAIVEKLLESGVCLDEDDTGDASCSSPLLESIRSGRLEVVETVLTYECTRFRVERIIRELPFALSVTSLDKMLSAILSHSSVAAPLSNQDVGQLFINKLFGTLIAQTEQDKLTTEPTVWQIIGMEMERVAMNNRRGNLFRIDNDHLQFLCDVAESQLQTRAVAVTSFVEFVSECVDKFLRCQADTPHCIGSMGFRNCEEWQKHLSKCLQHIKRVDQHLIRTAWLGWSIACGFYDSASIISESLLELDSGEQISLDVIFDMYARATRSTARQDVNHLCVWLTRLLLSTQAPSRVTISLRSFVCACAYNLPYQLTERCLSLLSDNGENRDSTADELLEQLPATRVNGKCLMQWLIVHNRLDVIRHLFQRIDQDMEAVWTLWRGLVFAACTISRNIKDDEFDGMLLSVFALCSTVDGLQCSAEKAIQLFEWFVVNCVVPNDCERLMAVLVPFFHDHALKMTVPEHQSPTSSPRESKLLSAFTRMRLVYQCSRWNAVRVFAFCRSNCFQTPSAQVWLVEAVNGLDEVDKCTPLAIARLMGHMKMLCLLRDAIMPGKDNQQHTSFGATSSLELDSAADPGQRQYNPFGFLRNVLVVHGESVGEESDRFSIEPAPFNANHEPSFTDDLTSVCKANRVAQLKLLLSLETVRLGDSQLEHLVMAAIAGGAVDSLKWLLASFKPAVGSMSSTCVHTAARHSGDVFAEMMLLLLGSGFFQPGRLAGDGVDTTILHRAACFENSDLARRAITQILAIEGCDINVLDAHGNTPLAYALGSGRLETACFLMEHLGCRLEAEYEGQASFYYTLQLVPSFSARYIVAKLLKARRNRAYLHCSAEDRSCACKSFETQAGADPSSDHAEALCNLCGHSFHDHTILPLPSWFRDQYDTYLDGRISGHNGKEQNGANSDDSASESGDERVQPLETSAVPSEDDVENTRGRLDSDLLLRVTSIKLGQLFLRLGLTPPTVSNTIVEPSATEAPPSLAENAAASDANLASWTMMQENVLGPNDPADRFDECESRILCNRVVTDADVADPLRLPPFLQADMAKLHPPPCRCQPMEYATTPQMVILVAASRWLRSTAANRSLGAIQLGSPSNLLQDALHRWLTAVNMQVRTTSKSRPDLEHSRGSQSQRSVLAHWRFGRELAAFHRWKRLVRPSTVAHHRLEAAVEGIAADMRRHRFETLQHRQRHVHVVAAALLHRLPPPPPLTVDCYRSHPL